MGLFLGIDLGTSYFKAGLFDEDGRLAGLGRQPVIQETGDGSICELSVPVFRKTLRNCVEEALNSADAEASEIESLSYSSQANSFILLDKNDKQLTPLILWPDKRASGTDLQGLVGHYNDEFLSVAGLGAGLNNEFAVAKLKWFQKERPGTWKRTGAILSISDYLTFMLTGRKISDTSTASLTGLLDIKTGKWWKKSLESFELDPGLLPSPERTGSFAGVLTKAGAGLTGLKPGIPYFIGALDHHCAAIGCGVTQGKRISESTGTVLACVSYSADDIPGAEHYLAPGLSSEKYFRMAFNDNGAVSLEWYRNTFAPDYSIPELLELAANVQPGCEGLIALPCANKYPDMEGFREFKPSHRHGHFVRALLESTAASLAGLIRTVKGSGFGGEVISTGGGAKSDLWVKIKADIINKVFLIPECTETACMGSAIIAARGIGKLGSYDELTDKWIRFRKIIRPG